MWHEVHPRHDDKYKTVIGTIVSHFLFDLFFFVLAPLPPIGGLVMGSNTMATPLGRCHLRKTLPFHDFVMPCVLENNLFCPHSACPS
jgi:hypothetical protein